MFAFAKIRRLQMVLLQPSTGMTVLIELDVVNSDQRVLLRSLFHTLNAPGSGRACVICLWVCWTPGVCRATLVVFVPKLLRVKPYSANAPTRSPLREQASSTQCRLIVILILIVTKHC